MTSPAVALVERLAVLGAEAPAALEAMLAQMSVTELAAIAHDWTFWARPKQLAPEGAWRSWGFLAGRGMGKTRALAEHVTIEVMAKRATRIGLAAQNEDKTLEVLVHGASGLITCSPPWCKARFENGRVVWPNGAQAFVYTPEVPGDIRGPEHDLVWLSELVAWPVSTRDESFSNFRRGCRLGYARTIWDTTPRARHPLVRYLLERSASRPERHVVVRGSTAENIANLHPDEVAEWYEELGGTQRGREELEGEYSDDADDALWQQAWIDACRVEMPQPAALVRRVLAIDPAIGTRDSSDATGMADIGLLADGQVVVIADMSSKHEAHEWGTLALDRYVSGGCDLIVAELNRGGNLVTQNLRAAAERRRLRVEVVDERWVPRRTAGVVHVREVHSKGSKAERAAPVATLYQRGRVSHVVGADLGALEALMTTWVPPVEGTRGGRRSPDALDALVMGVVELAGLRRPAARGSADVAAAKAVQAALAERIAPPRPTRAGGYVAPGTIATWGRGGAFGGGRRL